MVKTRAVKIGELLGRVCVRLERRHVSQAALPGKTLGSLGSVNGELQEAKKFRWSARRKMEYAKREAR